MESNASVLIVSAHGRGHWLAAELQRENIPVTFMDLTPKVGTWPPEDVTGPFGFFKIDELSESQKDRILCEDPYEVLEQGFTLWLPSGPVELKSTLTEYRLQKLGQKAEVVESFLKFSSSDKNRTALSKWAADHFQASWILHLAHQWASTTYYSNGQASLHGASLPLRSPFYVKKATRPGQAQATEWLRKQKVQVYQNTEILDLSFKNKNNVSGLEVQGERSGVLRADQIVWMLSSEETYYVNPKLAKLFFPEGSLEPEWSWVRYRLKMSACPERETLPLHLLMIQQIPAPWTHENLLVLQRTASDEQFDAWIRVPAVQRFNKEYLRIRGEKVLDILRQRLPLALPEIQSFPQEFYYTYSQLGPTAFPVFASGLATRRHHQAYSNLIFDSPETWRNYSWDDQFLSQTRIRDELQQWWKLLQQRKEKERDRAIHSP